MSDSDFRDKIFKHVAPDAPDLIVSVDAFGNSAFSTSIDSFVGLRRLATTYALRNMSVGKVYRVSEATLPVSMIRNIRKYHVKQPDKQFRFVEVKEKEYYYVIRIA